MDEIQKILEEKDRLIKEQEQKIAELKAANENLLRILRHGNKVKFGRSSEVTQQDAKQLCLLENDEELSEQLVFLPRKNIQKLLDLHVHE